VLSAAFVAVTTWSGLVVDVLVVDVLVVDVLVVDVLAGVAAAMLLTSLAALTAGSVVHVAPGLAAAKAHRSDQLPLPYWS
jgi:hypothetical protein